MNPELNYRPVQEDLFPTESDKPSPEHLIKRGDGLPEIDHANHRVRLEVEGFILTCALRDGKINIDSAEGVTDKRDIPNAVKAQAKKWAGGILQKAA